MQAQAQAQAQASQLMSIKGQGWFIPAESPLKPCDACKDGIGVKVVCLNNHLYCQSCYQPDSSLRDIMVCMLCQKSLHSREVTDTISTDLGLLMDATKFGCTMKGCDWTGGYGEMDLHLQSCKTRSADQRQEFGKSDYSERTVICDSCQSPYIARESESHKSNCQFDKPITVEMGGGEVTLYRQPDSVGPFYQEQDTDTTKSYSKVYVATTASHLKRLSSPAYRILPANAQCTLGGENCSVQEFREPLLGFGRLDWWLRFSRQSSDTHYFDFRMDLREQASIVKHFYSFPEFRGNNYMPDLSISGKTPASAGLRVDFYRSGDNDCFRQQIFHLKNIEDNRPNRLYLMEIVNHT